MAHKFEIYKDKAGEFRVRFSYNSEVMFSTQGSNHNPCLKPKVGIMIKASIRDHDLSLMSAS